MPKRGENIRKRKDGRWEARYIKSYTTEGKAKYGSVYGNSYYEAKKKLTEIIENTKNNKVLPTREMSFREVLFLWLTNNKIKLRQQTYNKYLDLIENHIIPCIGNEKISRLDSTAINGFLEQKAEKGRLDGKGGLSPNSIKAIIFIVQSAISFAVNEGMRNSFNGEVNRPSTKIKELEVLNMREQNTLENHLSYQIDSAKLGILICLHIGLRIGEICGLRWDDIDFEERTIHVRRTIERIRNMNVKAGGPKTVLSVGDPKTASSNRVIPIPNYLMSSILALNRSARSIYVIEGMAYEYLDPRTYQYRFQKYLNECQIRPVNFHALRHTFATRCIEVGMDIKSLSEILGHASVNITLNTYVHSSMEMKRSQMEMLSSIRGQ